MKRKAGIVEFVRLHFIFCLLKGYLFLSIINKSHEQTKDPPKNLDEVVVEVVCIQNLISYSSVSYNFIVIVYCKRHKWDIPW